MLQPLQWQPTSRRNLESKNCEGLCKIRIRSLDWLLVQVEVVFGMLRVPFNGVGAKGWLTQGTLRLCEFMVIRGPRWVMQPRLPPLPHRSQSKSQRGVTESAKEACTRLHSASWPAFEVQRCQAFQLWGLASQCMEAKTVR